MQNITVIRAEDSQIEAAKKIREEVFQKENCIAMKLDFDGNDDSAMHFIAFSHTKPIGTARVRFPTSKNQAKLERLAILPEYRGKGVGQQIMYFIEDELKKMYVKDVCLESIERVKGFYAKLGYESIGEVFEQAGIPHRKMIKKLHQEYEKGENK